MVERLKSGDTKAIELIYSAYFDRLYSLIFHSVNRDQIIAEDIVQDVFVSMIRSAQSFKGKSKIYTWLVAITHNKIHDYYRRKQREPEHNSDLINNDAISLKSINNSNQSVTEELESNEMELTLNEALSALPLHYRQVLLFKYVEEMTTIEISEIMGRSAKSVDGILTRARKLLKEKLSGNS